MPLRGSERPGQYRNSSGKLRTHKSPRNLEKRLKRRQPNFLSVRNDFGRILNDTRRYLEQPEALTELQRSKLIRRMTSLLTTVEAAVERRSFSPDRPEGRPEQELGSSHISTLEVIATGLIEKLQQVRSTRPKK